MTLCYISNYYNHHQSALAESFYERLGDNFIFVETAVMGEGRKELGYKIPESRPFLHSVIKDEEDRRFCLNFINNADVVVYGDGGIPLIRDRLKAGKLTFRYSERLFKNDKEKRFKLLKKIKYHFEFGKFQSFCLLCNSAYAYADYYEMNCYKNKAYKFGYFPNKINYFYDKLLAKKEENSVLWSGRLIGWKHPELILKLAKRLKEDKVNFHFYIMGNGEMEEELKAKTNASKLADSITFLGGIPCDKVRPFMEKAQIFLHTADFNEGWGVVINEALNSGCAVLSSHAVGAAPYLIKNNQNGLIYRSGDFDDLYNNLKKLLSDKPLCVNLGEQGYKTVFYDWNASVAADRFLALAESIKAGRDTPYKSGICSKAENLIDDWY